MAKLTEWQSLQKIIESLIQYALNETEKVSFENV